MTVFARITCSIATEKVRTGRITVTIWVVAVCIKVAIFIYPVITDGFRCRRRAAVAWTVALVFTGCTKSIAAIVTCRIAVTVTVIAVCI